MIQFPVGRVTVEHNGQSRIVSGSLSIEYYWKRRGAGLVDWSTRSAVIEYEPPIKVEHDGWLAAIERRFKDAIERRCIDDYQEEAHYGR